jgi:hypothetical protein
MRKCPPPRRRRSAPRGACVVALLGALALASAGCGGADAPIAVTPPSFDFGRVMKGDAFTQTFTVTNQGDRATGITAQSSCGCLVVEQRDLRPLEPGQSLEFRVHFDTRNLPAEPMRGKYVAVYTDRPDGYKTAVHFEAEIFQAYVLSPAVLDVGRIDAGPEDFEPRTVTIRPTGAGHVKFLGHTATPDVYDVEAAPFEQGGLTVSIRLRKGLSRPVGAYQAQVRLDLEVAPEGGKARRTQGLVMLRGFWERGG